MLFKRADASGSGKLSKAETEKTLKDAGFVYRGSWSDFMDKYDKDKDNFIDYAEFMVVLNECFGKELD